jgi:dienelactone hydrolase
MMLIGLLSFVLQVVFPMPTGEYAVGRTSYLWVDKSRDNIYTDDASDHRELMAVVWYPADPAPDAEPALWLDEAWIEPMVETFSADSEGLLTVSYAYLDAPPAANGAPFPVLVMSHGDTVPPWFYTSFAEELASHGYVVVGVSHTYNPWVTVFPDGRIIPSEIEAQSAGADLVPGSSFQEQLDSLWDHNSVMLDTWAEDLSFVVDQLENLSEDDPLAGMLDLSNLGVFGHSFGGAAAFEVLSRDARFVAGASLDGSPSNLYENGIQQPILLFTSAPPLTSEMLDQYRERLGLTEEEMQALEPRLLRAETLFEASPVAYRVMIDGASHSTYSDIPLVNEIVPFESGPPGDIDPVYAHRIISDVMLDFFDHALKGQPNSEDLFYPELHIEGHRN